MSGGQPPGPARGVTSIGQSSRSHALLNVATVALRANPVKGVASLTVATYAFDVSDEWLSTGQAAERLGVHRSTLVRYIEEGRLPASRLPTGHYRIRRADLEKLLAEGEFGRDQGE